MKLFLDDIRYPDWVYPDWTELGQDGDWIVARTYKHAVEILETGKVTHISLDYDLSSCDGTSGITVARVMQRLIREGKIPVPGYMHCHSSHPWGKQEVYEILEEIKRHSTSSREGL